jgi:triacylglycerol lipase
MRKFPARLPEPTDVDLETHRVPGPPGALDIRVYVYRPRGFEQPTAALLYIHGGGFMIGSAPMFHATCAGLARELGIVVVNVDYRLAPEVPFPGPLQDCYAALRWMKQQADRLGIDPARIAVMGESAGGGLAAALAQFAHDRGEIDPAFQLLLYAMLDDRTVLKCDHEDRGEFLWTPGSNRLGWTSYLGHPPTMAAAPEYAAPARRQNLRGLAPAWIGVGTLDLFYPENKAYARRLNEAGVPCELYEVAGAYHGFDGMRPGASVSKAFRARSMEALRRGLRLA